MRRGNNITPDEIKKIAFLHDRGLTHREIEDIVGRSDTAIGKIVAAYETTKGTIDLSDYKESTMYQGKGSLRILRRN